MAKIPLRTYIKEVENLIERGEIEKAIANAKNILKTYPKHIETYRLLGKAYLESQRYSEAIDILQRVLSVIPDDFISQIGVSIIREDEGNFDAAIWHMERAYEVQPFNPAVQDELRRLYGRRDGIEPPKIRLTRGALIRMYARGELYPQAIAETRSALAEDPQRLDLQVLLARLYFLNGQKVEATEVCGALISKLPYCFEANLILSEVLPGTSRAEDAQAFQQRLYALDPYVAYISPSAPTADQVPDQAVMVEQFLFEAALEENDQRPDWARDMGVEWQETEEEQLPDWLNTLAPHEQNQATRGEVQTPEPPKSDLFPAATANDEDSMPDFMKAAGWTKSDRSADEIMKEQLQQTGGEEDEDEFAAPAELPDWMQSMAPPVVDQEDNEQDRLDLLDSILSGQTNSTSEPQPTPQEDEAMDWMAGIAAISGVSDEDAVEKNPQPEASDWLSDLESDAITPATNQAPDTASGLDTPDWLSDLGQGQPATPAEESLPDWFNLSDDSSAESASPAGQLQEEGAPEEDTSWLAVLGMVTETPVSTESAEELPDWMQAEDVEEQKEDQFSPSTAWMRSSEDEESAARFVEELSAEPVQENDEEKIPDWLSDVSNETMISFPADDTAETQPSIIADDEASPIVEEEPFEFETLLSSSEPTETEIKEEGLPDWLLDSSSDGEPSEPTMVAEGTVSVDAGDEVLPIVDEPQEMSPIQSEPASVETETAGMPDFSDMDAAMAWLESLAAKHGADEATLTTRPEERQETPPEWLQQETPTAEIAVEENTVSVQEPSALDEQAIFEEDLLAQVSEQPATESDELEIPLAALDFGMDETEAAGQEQVSKLEEQPPQNLAEFETEDSQEEADFVEKTQPVRISPVDVQTHEVQMNEEMDNHAETGELPNWLSSELAEEPAPVENDMEGNIAFSELSLSEIQMTSADSSLVSDEEAKAETEIPQAGEEQPSIPDFSDMDAAMAWLEALAAKQGADEATLTTQPEDRLEAPPEWVKQEIEQSANLEEPLVSQSEEPASEMPAETGGEWQTEEQMLATSQDASAPEWPAEATEDETLVVDQSAPRNLDMEPVEWVPEIPEPTLEQPETPESEALPDWLQETELDEGVVSQPAQAPEASLEDWLHSLETESVTQPAETVEVTPEPSITEAWQVEETPETGAPVIDPALTGQDALMAAQNAINRGHLEPALNIYNQFINDGDLLEEVIHDLRDALYRYPVDISVWQALGDAYARNNQLQEALDAYTKAEELLR